MAVSTLEQQSTGSPSKSTVLRVAMTAGGDNAREFGELQAEPLSPLARHFRTVVYDDILTAFVFKERVDVDRLRAEVAETVCKHPRFRSCMVIILRL